ncbi:hypothetical protein LINPERHAP1_LOCUS39700 [Linum perenne]
MTAAAARRPTPTFSTPHLPSRQGCRRREKPHASKKKAGEESMAGGRTAAAVGFENQRTSPKGERKSIGEETTGAVKVAEGHAFSGTTKQVTFLEG